jgi:hypothetical protein
MALDLDGRPNDVVRKPRRPHYAQDGLRSAANQGLPKFNGRTSESAPMSDPFAPSVILVLPSQNYRYLEPTLACSVASVIEG